jgi:hypothetical protein
MNKWKKGTIGEEEEEEEEGDSASTASERKQPFAITIIHPYEQSRLLQSFVFPILTSSS